MSASASPLRGKLTLATPAPWYGTNCSAGRSVCDEQDQVMPDATLGYKSLDVALQKRWDTGTDLGLKVRLDVLNLFDWVNYNYPRWFRAPGDGDPPSPPTPRRPGRARLLWAGRSAPALPWRGRRWARSAVRQAWRFSRVG